MNHLFIGVGMTQLESGGKGKKRRGKGGRRDSGEKGRGGGGAGPSRRGGEG